jgi:hypothetical protein
MCCTRETLTDLSYDASSAIALVRAAERAKSPAILQLFPITLAYGKGPFLQFCLDVQVPFPHVSCGQLADVQGPLGLGPYRRAP